MAYDKYATTVTVVVEDADEYSDWVFSAPRAPYYITITWNSATAPPGLTVQSKLLHDEDAAAIDVAVIDVDSETSGMRADVFSGQRLWRVGVASGETVNDDITLTIQV